MLSIVNLTKLKIGLLLLLLLTACSPNNNPVSVTFKPVYDGMPIVCDKAFKIAGKDWSLSTLQFYVSGITIHQNGVAMPLSSQLSDWQSEHVALIGGDCGSGFNWQANYALPELDSGKMTLSFNVGVPFELNHLNPLTQQSPLNQSDMFWSWQLGHKFLRLDLVSEDGGWAFHAGSVGCEAPSPMRAPKEQCQFPNRAMVTIEGVDFSKPIQFDVGRLLNGLELTEETRCMSSPETASCAVLLKRLGVGSASEVFSGSAH